MSCIIVEISLAMGGSRFLPNIGVQLEVFCIGRIVLDPHPPAPISPPSLTHDEPAWINVSSFSHEDRRSSNSYCLPWLSKLHYKRPKITGSPTSSGQAGKTRHSESELFFFCLALIPSPLIAVVSIFFYSPSR